MAGDEGARIASAFIEIKARKAFSDAEVRRMGQEAGREYEKGFDGELERGKGRHAAQGKAAGAVLGDAAGKEAGGRASTGLVAGLARARSRVEREGEALGDGLGDGTSRSFGRRFLTGLRSSTRSAAKTLESDISQGLARGFKRGLTGAAGVGALASSASGLGTVLSGTVGAVVQLSGAVGVLPGAFAAAGAASGALKLGVTGVGDALKDSGDPKKYAEDIKALSPAARSFTDAVVKLRPQLKALKNSVQDGLFKGADKEVKALGDRYLPVMKTRLTEITGEFNRGGRSVADYLDHAKQSKDVDGILDNTRRSVGHLADAFKPVTGALLDIVKVGSDQLPGLSKQVEHAADRLAGMVKGARDDGSMKRFFQGGIDAAKDLARVGKGAGRILGGIFAAGGGANTNGLETLAGLLGKVADQVNSPAFQHGLGDFFNSIGDAGGSVGDALPKVADALVALEPAAAKLVRGSGKALAATLTTASDAAIKLAPTLNALAGALEGVSPHVGPLILVLLGLKGALVVVKTAAKVADTLDILTGSLDRMGGSSKAATGRLGGLSGAMGAVGAAATVIGVAAAARQIGDMSGKADVATVNTGRLADSLVDLDRGGRLGAEGMKLFAGKGAFGLLTNNADTSSEALKRFGTNAYNALDKGWDARLGRWQSFGQAESTFRKQTQQLDGAFADLASHGRIDSAASSFGRFLKAGKDAGVPVASLVAQFPEFTARLRTAGLTVDTTTGKVVYLSGALKGLPTSRNIRINTPGMTEAAARAYALSENLRRLPHNKVVTVTTHFYKVGKEPGTFGNGLGVYRAHGGPVPKLASGGQIDPRLGGPRQDNVPLWGSGGEYVVNAYATAAKGVLPLLRYINAANKLPQKLASGGQVARVGGAGLSDLTASAPARIARMEAAGAGQQAGPARMHPDDIALIVGGFAAAVRQQRIVLDSGAVAGAVYEQGGRVWG